VQSIRLIICLTSDLNLEKTCLAAGKPLFGTLISLLDRGRPILGIIDQPILRERWLGARGRHTTLNGTPLPQALHRAANAANVVDAMKPVLQVPCSWILQRLAGFLKAGKPGLR